MNQPPPVQEKLQKRVIELEEANSNLVNQLARLQELNDELRELSIIDDLTGILNLRGFLQAMKMRFVPEVHQWSGDERRHRRRDPETHGTLVAIDLSGFKGVNDALTRQLGDQLLIMIAHTLRESVRDIDLAARMSGDEFLIFFHRQPKSFAEERMKYVHRRVREITLGMTLEEIQKALCREFLVDFRYTMTAIDRRLDFHKLSRSMFDRLEHTGPSLRLAHLSVSSPET